jgi:hypothetical protein
MPKTLGLVADPVVVAETVERTGPDVAARLSGDWHVRTDEQTFPAGQELRELSQRAEELADEHGWDAVIGLTDLPMVVDGVSVPADVSPADRVAVPSVPALGPLMLRRRLCRAVVRVAEAIEGGVQDARPAPARPHHPGGGRPPKAGASSRRAASARAASRRRSPASPRSSRSPSSTSSSRGIPRRGSDASSSASFDRMTAGARRRFRDELATYKAGRRETTPAGLVWDAAFWTTTQLLGASGLTYWADGQRDHLRALVEGDIGQPVGNTAASPAAQEGEPTSL